MRLSQIKPDYACGDIKGDVGMLCANIFTNMHNGVELPHITENMILEEYLIKRQAWIQAYKMETKEADGHLQALREEIDSAFWGRKKLTEWLK